MEAIHSKEECAAIKKHGMGTRGSLLSFSDGSGETRVLLRIQVEGLSLVVQLLRIHLPMQGTWAQSLFEELRSNTPLSN